MYRLFSVFPVSMLALVLSTASMVHAQSDDANRPGLALPASAFEVVVPLNVNLSDGVAAEPISLSPDIWYGVTDEVSVGLIHSVHGALGFFGFDGAIGTGLCFTGEDHGCAGGAYNNLGGEVLYAFMNRDGLHFAGNGGFQAGSLDPFVLALKVGMRSMWRSGKFAAMVAPSLFFGITERDSGNDESFTIPLTAHYAVTDTIHAGVQSGIGGDFQGFADTYFIPVSFAGHYVWNEFTVGGVFSIPFLGASDVFGGGGVASRTVSLVGSYRGSLW
ncbi:MAG: hypothetical protein MJE77_20580 [Proteobacteria bacterium]|nr:hypothetical protein [Pseudomonadota bacterium]